MRPVIVPLKQKIVPHSVLQADHPLVRSRRRNIRLYALSCNRSPYNSGMEGAWADMNSAAMSGDIRELVNADLRFHLSLCEQSGNRFLLEHARRLLMPLFAFVLMRVYTNRRGSQPWAASFGLHGRILEVLRMGDPFIAEQVVMRATDTFASVAYEDWEGSPVLRPDP